MVAIFEDGGKLTLDEFNGLLRLHPSWQGKPAEDVIHGYALVRKAAQLAQEQKLNDKSPYKDELKAAVDFEIMWEMADFLVRDAADSVTVDHSEIEKYYNEHKDIYKEVKVSGIRIAIGGSTAPADTSANASRPVKKALTEDEAKAKADTLVAQLHSGADFCKTVLLESDDDTNKTRCGEITTLKMTDNVPDLMRSAVLGLKEGDVSDPVRQANAYYIFHADGITYTPLKDVEDSIFATLKQQHAHEWMQNFDKSTKVTIIKPGEQDPPSEPKK